jgi:ATP-dependent exoDNAse (exonuclease V) beta subunit
MLLKKIYEYPSIRRMQSDIGRQYLTPDGNKVPSVTTVLDKTKPIEKVQALNEWRNRVGHAQAAEITKNAASRGTIMHKRLEEFIVGEMKPPGSNVVHAQAAKMADAIIEQYMKPYVDEIWGSEVNLYYTGLYAGTTDCVGVWKDKPAIIDFKQTNKPKKREWIDDYFLQLSAYAHAHNHIYGTDIQQGVILMCSGELETQLFELTFEDFTKYSDVWWKRVEEYHLKNA